MRLISCHVENFGRLHDFDYVFSDGLNVICRENGWGKSTFAAFLLAMLYGLPSKGRKRQAVSSGDRLSGQNARTAYRPWQGGVFGGKLIFEAGGRAYEMTRVFGEREAQDEFDLRDFDTNLPCFDYTADIGGELFSLDRESFLRTVFTAQQDCVTKVTDDINALIADLAEYAGDMKSYEAAQRRLKEAANRLTPKRAAGRLHSLSAQIGRLERKTSASDDLEERIALCRREQGGLEGKRERLEAERARLTEAITAAERREEDSVRMERADRELLAKRQILRRLYDTKERRSSDLRKASAFFPRRIPARAETDAFLRNCREMERLEARMQTEMLTEEEQERLTFLEERFADVPAAGRKQEVSKRSVVLFLTGILLVLAGAALPAAVMGTDPAGGIPAPAAAAAVVLAAAGVGSAVAGVLNRPSAAGSGRTDRSFDASVRHSPDFHRQGACDPNREESGRADGASCGEEGARSYAEYLYLEKKEQKTEETYASWSEARKPVLRFLKELGFPPAQDLHAQIASIRDAADACEDAAALLRESEEELRLFEEELDSPGLTAGIVRRSGQPAEEMHPGGPAPEEERRLQRMRLQAKDLRNSREQVQEELLQCRAQTVDVQRRMEALLAEREEREAMLEELKELREQRETDRAGYRHLTTASALLQKARESLTARYTDPIRRNFSRYWEMITGYSALGVYVDANSNVTIDERGKQRDAALLSTGWRDLAGICLRAALADAMYPPDRRERPPLILDDPFTNLDDEKIEGAMRFLRETGRHYQILYFTCSSTRC